MYLGGGREGDVFGGRVIRRWDLVLRWKYEKLKMLIKRW